MNDDYNGLGEITQSDLAENKEVVSDESTPVVEEKVHVIEINDDETPVSFVPEEATKPDNDFKPNPVEELENSLPVLEVVKEVEKKENTEEKKSPKEVLMEINKRINSNAEGGDVSIWTLGQGQVEVKPSSVEIELSGKRVILRDIREWDKNNPKDVERVYRALPVPSDTGDNVLKQIIANPGSLTDTDSDVALNIAADARDLTSSVDGVFEEALNDTNAGWRQGFRNDSTRKNISSKNAVLPLQDGDVNGIYALAAVKNAMGFSGFFTVVLPHSGMVAIISAPLPSELVDLQHILDTSKINVGRSYGGANYGATTWFINSKIVDLFIRKISRINLKDSRPENIKALLDPMDIPSIAWGLAAAMYPNGYDFTRTAFTEEGKSKILVGNLWLPDMLVAANNRLSIRQKQHLENGVSISSSNEEILSYKRNWKKEEDIEEDKYLINSLTSFDNGDEVKTDTYIVFKHSSLVDYIHHGNAWEVYLKDALNSVLAMEPDENTRAGFLNQKIIATQLREYSYMIKEIRIVRQIGEGEAVTSIKSEEDIFTALETFSIEPTIRKAIIDASIKYLNKRLLVTYGVPTVSQWESENISSPISTCIVPINTVSTFFILTARIYQQLGLNQTN